MDLKFTTQTPQHVGSALKYIDVRLDRHAMLAFYYLVDVFILSDAQMRNSVMMTHAVQNLKAKQKWISGCRCGCGCV